MKGFTFDPRLWLGNFELRLCSPQARSLCIDLMCLCYPTGYLPDYDDDQITKLLGISAEEYLEWLKELGERKIFHVSADDRLYFNTMVEQHDGKNTPAKLNSTFSHKAFKTPETQPGTADSASAHEQAPEVVKKKRGSPSNASKAAAKALEATLAPATVLTLPQAQNKPVAAPKILPWYMTPAGWVRKGGEQAVAYTQDCDFDEFKYKVAKRLGMGLHLDYVSPHYRQMILDEIEKHKPKEKKAQA